MVRRAGSSTFRRATSAPCLTLATITVAVILWIPGDTRAAGTHAAFTGEKTVWHGFDRYDFLMDEQTLSIKPATAAGAIAGQRRCIVVVPKKPAPGNPWSWRGCYWDHEPQTEIELPRRGFQIAYVTADFNLKPSKHWDA